MAGSLAVLGEGLQALGDEVHVGLVDVEPQQPQTPRGAAAHDVQELQRLTHQVVVGLVVLAAQEVLHGGDTGYYRRPVSQGATNQQVLVVVVGL